MLLFLRENFTTIVVCLILVLIVALILVKMVKDRKTGKSCHCGTGCEGCSGASLCHAPKEKS